METVTVEPEEITEPEPEEKTQTIAERRESIRKEVAKKGLLGVLGGRGGASVTRRSSALLSGGARAADLDKVLDQVKGLQAGRADGDWKGRKIDADGAEVWLWRSCCNRRLITLQPSFSSPSKSPLSAFASSKNVSQKGEAPEMSWIGFVETPG